MVATLIHIIIGFITEFYWGMQNSIMPAWELLVYRWDWRNYLSEITKVTITASAIIKVTRKVQIGIAEGVIFIVKW